MKNLTWILMLPLLAGLTLTAACGETNGDEDGGTADAATDAGPECDAQNASATPIDVSGTSSVHPVSAAMDPTLTMADLSMTLEDPVQVLAGRDAALQYPDCTDAVVDLTPITGMESAAEYMFTDVDTQAIALGLVATFAPINGNTSFVKTTMGLASGPQAADLVVATPSFAISAATEGALAQLTGGSPGDLQTAGWIFGMFIDATMNPIAGVALVDDAGSPIAGVTYPNATFSGVEAGITSANGLFVVSGASLTEYFGDCSGASCTACASQQAATNAGSAFVVVLGCQ